MIVETFYPIDATDFQEIHSFKDIAPRTADRRTASSRKTVVDFKGHEYSRVPADAPAMVTRNQGSALVAVAAVSILLGIALAKTH